MPVPVSVRWQLADNSGGTAYVTDSEGHDTKYSFHTFAELPRLVADVIKADGRDEGDARIPA